MTNEESKRIIDENAAMAVACTYNVLFTNDIVSGLALDAVESQAGGEQGRTGTEKVRENC